MGRQLAGMLHLPAWLLSCASPLPPVQLTGANLREPEKGVKPGFTCTLTGQFDLCSLSCGHSRA
jgi:hypothetical protein